MGEIADQFASVFRPFQVDGVPASGPNKPSKAEAAALGTILEQRIAAASAGLKFYETTAARDADTAQPIGTLGRVADDPKIYRYDTGGWVEDTAYYEGVAQVVQPLVDAGVSEVEGLVSEAQQALLLVEQATEALYVDTVFGRKGALISGAPPTNNSFGIGPLPALDTVKQFDLLARANGTVQAARYTLSGGIVTRQAISAVVNVTAGQTVSLLSDVLGGLGWQEGDWFYFYANGPLGYTASSTSDTFQWYQIPAGLPETATPTTGNPASRLEVQLITSKRAVSAAAFTALQAATSLLQATVSADTIAVSLLKKIEVVQIIARSIADLTALAAGAAGSAANASTIFFAAPAAKKSLLRVDTLAAASGTMTVGRYNPSTTPATLVASYAYPVAGAGLRLVAEGIPVEAGEIISVQGAGTFTYDGSGEPSGYYASAAVTPATFTIGTKSTANRFHVALTFTETTHPVTAEKFEALQAAVATGGSGGSGSPTLPLSQANRLALPSAGSWAGLLSYGQSLSSGWLSVPPISTSQPYSNLTFGSGPKSGKAGNTYGATNTSPGTSTSKPLAEDTASADGANSTGETPCSGAANGFVELAYINNGIDPAANVVFASAPGHGSYLISQLDKSSAWYGNFLDHVRDANALAVAAGKTYRVDAVSWMQGEANTRSTDTVLALQTALLQLHTDIDTDVRAITGQAEPVHMFLYQTATTANASRTNLDAPRLAQVGAVNARPELIHFVAPVVHLPPATDNVHLSAVAELWYGRMLGRAIYQAVYEARQPDCVWPVRAYAKGTALTIRFRVPRFPLVLDTNTFGALTDMGFKVADDTGNLTISNVQVGADGASVTMTLNRALGPNPVVRHGLDYTSALNTFQMSKNGCLRDSTLDKMTIGGTVRQLWHVAPAFQMPVRVLAADS